MPRRLRRLRFTSRKTLPIIHLLSTRTNLMGLCFSKPHWGKGLSASEQARTVAVIRIRCYPSRSASRAGAMPMWRVDDSRPRPDKRNPGLRFPCYRYAPACHARPVHLPANASRAKYPGFLRGLQRDHVVVKTTKTGAPDIATPLRQRQFPAGPCRDQHCRAAAKGGPANPRAQTGHAAVQTQGRKPGRFYRQTTGSNVHHASHHRRSGCECRRSENHCRVDYRKSRD